MTPRVAQACGWSSGPALAHGRVVSAGEAFDAHWRRVLADDSAVKRTIVDGDAVAGNIGC